MNPEDFKKHTRTPAQMAKDILDMPVMHMIEGQDFRTFLHHLDLMKRIACTDEEKTMREKRYSEQLLEALETLEKGEKLDFDGLEVIKQAPRMVGRWITEQREMQAENEPQPKASEPPGRVGPVSPVRAAIDAFEKRVRDGQEGMRDDAYKNSKVRAPQLTAVQSALIDLNQALGLGRGR